MKVMVFPRDDQNPYQRMLYGEMERLGTAVSYLGRLTPSHTLNLLLLPLETAVRRAAGARLVHLHWVFGFSLPGSGRFPSLRRLAQAWFVLWLSTTRLLGVHVVWTAHNVLPHAPVFADDVAARRALVATSHLVLAHSPSALAGLAALGAVPSRSTVIPHGPLAPVVPCGSIRAPGIGSGPRQVLFFGKILEYKGVDDLLAAFTGLSAGAVVQLVVAGQCDDPAAQARLSALAQASRKPVVLRLERIPDRDVASLFESADVVALPYRHVTTSGCAMLALAYGRPLIVPESSAFAHLPRDAVVRFDGTRPGLTSALSQVANADSPALAAMSAAARAYAAELSWSKIAMRTKNEMQSVLGIARLDESATIAEAADR
jgi:glycosyltransferase involved in cell wall biosynthesis